MVTITPTPSPNPSPTFSEDEDFNHWHEIDRSNKAYQVAVQNEKKYIFESRFDVNISTYKIIIGFSAARNNIPAVRIWMPMSVNDLVNKKNNISFDKEEWCDFIACLKQFSNDYFKDDSRMEEEVQFSNYSISRASPFMNTKMLKVINGFTTFYLSGNTVREFININKLVMANINILHDLNFASFYNNFLNVVNNILCESNYELCSENIMLNICDSLPGNIQMYCIRECLFLNRNKILNDLNRKK